MSAPILATEKWGGQVLVVPDKRPDLIAARETPTPPVIFGGLRGPQGPQGIPGPEAGAAYIRTAGETLSALRVVYELNGQVYYLDPADADHIDSLLGVTLTAATVGSTVNVQRSGVVEDSAWNWIPGRVWLGANGSLTQTPPLFGFDVLIGNAVSPTRIVLNIQDAILLEV